MDLKWILLIIFSVIALIFICIELFYCFKDDEKKRKFFKCFSSGMVIPLLIIINPQNWLLYIAAIFAVLGDLFLIIKVKNSSFKSFTIGAICFAMSHLIVSLKLLEYIQNTVGHISIYVYFGLICFIALSVILAVIYDKKAPFAYRVGAPIYASFLLLNIGLNLSLVFIANNALFLIPMFGYIIFMLSDSLIGVSHIVKQFKRKHFYVMLTYLIALYMILISLAFLI